MVRTSSEHEPRPAAEDDGEDLHLLSVGERLETLKPLVSKV